MKEILKTDKSLIQSIILIVVLYAGISLLSAVFGIFYPIFIWTVWFLICIFLYIKNIITFTKPSNEFLIYIFIAIGFSLLIAFFTVPTIFSGRDQGSLSEAAMRLSQNHTLIQHTSESDIFFDIYGPGKALNFPGFFYTQDGGLLTQFPLPYTAFISGFYGVFGVNGLIISNVVLLFTFIISITAVARYYMSKRYTLVFLLILLSSFSIGWFAKFTLSENIAGALLWSAFALFLFLKTDLNLKTYFTLFLTVSILLFARIEGIWFFVIFSFLIFHNKHIWNFLRKDLWWRVVFPLTVLFAISLSVAIMNTPFIISIIKAGTSSNSPDSTTLFMDKITYLFSIYSLYGLLLPLSITVIAIVFAIIYKRYRKILLPLLIVLPLMLYYFFPNISSDHPWMLRRFVFALLPTTLLISVAFLSYLRSDNIIKKGFKYTMLVLLFITNLFAFTTFITYAENKTLSTQVSDFSQKFNDNDLLLIDKEVAGNGWSMITNPLRSLCDKHAVYFFNPNDYTKLDTSSFDKVYLIIPDKNQLRYISAIGDKMKYNGKYTFEVNQLEEVEDTMTFPLKKNKIIHVMIYELNKN
jgi:hypothetical protein